MKKSILEQLLFDVIREQRYARSQWVTVLVSFAFAVTLWFLVTLNSQTFSYGIRYPVKVSNIPHDVEFIGEVPSKIQLELKGAGLALLSEVFNFHRDTIQIDFRSYSGSGYHVLSRSFPSVGGVIPLGLNPIGATPDTINLDFAKQESRMVPIQSNIDFRYKEAYRTSRPIEISPESVLVKGPASYLKDIKYWPTTQTTTKILSEKSSFEVPLDSVPHLQAELDKVNVRVFPEPFSQDKKTVPIYIKNLPKRTSLILDPSEIVVEYLVSMEKFDSVQPGAFQIVVDYDKVNERSLYVIPTVERKPAYVDIKRLSPPRIKYLISKSK